MDDFLMSIELIKAHNSYDNLSDLMNSIEDDKYENSNSQTENVYDQAVSMLEDLAQKPFGIVLMEDCEVFVRSASFVTIDRVVELIEKYDYTHKINDNNCIKQYSLEVRTLPRS